MKRSKKIPPFFAMPQKKIKLILDPALLFIERQG